MHKKAYTDHMTNLLACLIQNQKLNLSDIELTIHAVHNGTQTGKNPSSN